MVYMSFIETCDPYGPLLMFFFINVKMSDNFISYVAFGKYAFVANHIC